MKLRITVEVEVDDERIDSKYFEGKLAQLKLAYEGRPVPLPVRGNPSYTEAYYSEDIRKHFALDLLDRYHGAPKEVVKTWKVIENKIVG